MIDFKQRRRSWLISLGLFFLALIPRVLQLGTFWGTDERYHWQLSNEFFLALLQRDWANTVPQGLPGLTLAWIDSIAMALHYAWNWLVSGEAVSLDQIMAVDRPFALLAQRQLPVVIVNALIVVGLFNLSRRILGQQAAWIGAIFIILDPFLLAESRVLRFEGLVAGLMPLSLLAALLYLKERRFSFLVLSAALTALAMLTKISAAVLLPVVGLFGAAMVLGLSPVSRQEIRQWLSKYAIWVGLVAFCFWLFWPAMWVAPLETLREVWNFAAEAGSEGLEGRGVFFWGQVFPDDPGLWFYPVALLFRLTPLVLVGVGLAVIGLATAVKRRWATHSEMSRLWWGAASLLGYSLLFVLIMTLGAKKYDRYLMPIFPTLDLVAGAGWFWLYRVARRKWRGAGDNPALTGSAKHAGRGAPEASLAASPYIFAVFSILLLVLQGLTTLPHLPYYYTYYNPLLGGPGRAVDFIRVGFAEGLDRVAAYMESKPNASGLKLASANSSKLDGLFSGQTIAINNLDGKWTQADYVLIYISQLQRGKHSADILTYLARRNPEYTLELHGLEYGRLYPAPAAQFYGGGDKLEGRGTLFGYNLSATELPAGESLLVTLFWRNEGQREDDRFFVRLMDLDGYVWAEAIAQPRPGFEEANRTENSIVESEASLTLPVGMPPGDYFFKPGFRTAGGEIIGYFDLPGDAGPINVTPAPAHPAPGTFLPAHPAQLPVNTDLAFLGYDLDSQQLAPGSTVWVTLYWQALADVSHDYVILLRLLDDRQQEAAYWLGRPVRSGYPTTGWLAGQVVQDPWLLTIPTEASPGVYRVELAIFDAASEAELGRQTLTRLTVN